MIQHHLNVPRCEIRHLTPNIVIEYLFILWPTFLDGIDDGSHEQSVSRQFWTVKPEWYLGLVSLKEDMGSGDNGVGNVSSMDDGSDKVGKWWLEERFRKETFLWTTKHIGDKGTAGFSYAFMTVESSVTIWYRCKHRRFFPLLPRWEFEHNASKCRGRGIVIKFDDAILLRLTWFSPLGRLGEETAHFWERLDDDGWILMKEPSRSRLSQWTQEAFILKAMSRRAAEDCMGWLKQNPESKKVLLYLS